MAEQWSANPFGVAREAKSVSASLKLDFIEKMLSFK